ncbi:MAG: VOC family protein [Proteobacteria bacterium]|nr:VOC family protein [Pseudomonadota bacterium]
MPLSRLDHFLLQPADIEATKDWYVNVLGFELGPHPKFPFPVYWLYLEGKDVLHLSPGGAAASANRLVYLGQESRDTVGSGVIDHVAFRASGLAEMIARLQASGVSFRERRVDDQSLYQLFLIDPNGVKVELNFDASEAANRRATVTAADLA